MPEAPEAPIKALEGAWVLPSFSVSVRPCGTVGAFSDPNIVICSELMADLSDRGLDDAVYPILFHEVAHTLLSLWKLPGYQNEDLADEFAAALLGASWRETVDALVKYLEAQDSVGEAVMQLVNGDRHALSLQRARNMREVLAHPGEILDRWDKLLSGHRPSAPASKTASAGSAASTPPTAADITEECGVWVNTREKGSSDLTPAGAVQLGHCAGFFQGLAAGLNVGRLICPERHKIRIPEGAANDQIIRVFLKYADAHPEKLHFPALDVALLSLLDAFPDRSEKVP